MSPANTIKIARTMLADGIPASVFTNNAAARRIAMTMNAISKE